MEENKINAETTANEVQSTAVPSEKQYDVSVADSALNGKLCPFCKTDIKEGEEVIICPSCNTPHHKGCWEENKGCTTFGCSEQHYEAQGTNPTDVCPNCGATLGDGQAFCPKCGTPKSEIKSNICSNCGTELQEAQEFCPKCGQKSDLIIKENANRCIKYINAEINIKKTRLSPACLIVLSLAIILVGLSIYIPLRPSIYISKVNSLMSQISESNKNLETVGNAMEERWYKYVNGYITVRDGEYISSVTEAVDLAREEHVSEIEYIEFHHNSIISKYENLYSFSSTNKRIKKIKDAVIDMYDAYKDMYSCVISPSGSYYKWRDEFRNSSSKLESTINELTEII